MTTVKNAGIETMRVTRDIQDKDVAKWLQTVPEDVLVTLREEAEADEEISAAIRHSLEHDNPADNMSTDEFLASVKKL